MSRRLPRWAILALVLLGATAGLPAAAHADGDPGSDKLVYQTLFVPSDADLSVGQQTSLGRLLTATLALHAPVRVAIIPRAQDLGAIPQAFNRPVAYARYLGTELSQAYAGRLLVVMPNGTALYWYAHGAPRRLVAGRGAAPAQLTAAAVAGIEAAAAGAGISPARLDAAARSAGLTSAALAAARDGAAGAIATTAAPAAATGPTAGGGAIPAWAVTLAVIVVLGLCAVGVRRRRGRLVPPGLLERTGIALPGLALGVVAVGVLAVLALAQSGRSGVDEAQALATNPGLATLSPLTPRPAPPIHLTDETGRPVSLSEYRGKVVLLSFDDAECQTICPLTTQALVDARDSLGVARDRVQLLGVDTNPHSTQIADVLNYTQLHGLLGQWHFLTGPLARLRHVWNAYAVGGDLASESTLVDHTPLIWVIDPQGRVRYTSITYASYASIPQFGQELARAASGLLPGHPAVHTNYSYAPIRGVTPDAVVRLPKVGGGTVTLGRGGPHLYLFFATWDRQTTAIAAQMRQLNAYVRLARRRGLPPITAIDEASVEPGPGALSRFLAGLHLDYPVAIDASGRVADGYGVQGEPWFILAVPHARNTATDPTAETPWQQEVYTEGWPTLKELETTIPAALRPASARQSAARVARMLAGSPPALAALHAQAGRLLDGGPDGAALVARLRALRGHPVVVNVWRSTCPPCLREFDFFGVEAARYGTQVGFLGLDYLDVSSADAAGFLARNPVSYPSYALDTQSVPAALLPGGVTGTPETIFLGPDGKVRSVKVGSYLSQQELDGQIQAYALGR